MIMFPFFPLANPGTGCRQKVCLCCVQGIKSHRVFDLWSNIHSHMCMLDLVSFFVLACERINCLCNKEKKKNKRKEKEKALTRDVDGGMAKLGLGEYRDLRMGAKHFRSLVPSCPSCILMPRLCRGDWQCKHIETISKEVTGKTFQCSS